MEISRTVKIYLESNDLVIRIVPTAAEADLILGGDSIIVNYPEPDTSSECLKENVVIAQESPKTVGYPDNIEMDISNMLTSFGIPAHIRGYRYIRDALKVIISDPNVMNAVTKGLYPDVADMFDTTPSKVERAIRHAIGVAFARGNENLKKTFSNFPTKGGKTKPTNSEFLASIADKFRLENEKIK